LQRVKIHWLACGFPKISQTLSFFAIYKHLTQIVGFWTKIYRQISFFFIE
jgi:hypothetical protein